MKRNGFTFVELLAVIAIIGILATIAMVNLNASRTKSLTTAAVAEMASYANAIVIARQQSHMKLMDITGSVWSAGPCICSTITNGVCTVENDLDTRGLNKTTVSDTTTQQYKCWNQLFTDAQKIQAASGGLVTGLVNSTNDDLGPAAIDPWGSPYLIDENEGELAGSYCRVDFIYSNGPNGKDTYNGSGNAKDNIHYLIPPVSCSPPIITAMNGKTYGNNF